jgi:energy-coupling factor transport system permease protein
MVAVPLILNALAKSQKLEIVLQSKACSRNSERTYLHEFLLTNMDFGIAELRNESSYVQF